MIRAGSGLMKKAHWLLFFILVPLSLNGQRNSDYGLFAGVSSYFGDINSSRYLYAPMPAGGIIYRYNFNPREALRADLFVGGLRGNDRDFSNSFQQARGASFSGTVGELAIQFEFNFLRYSTEGKRWDFSPYFSAGAGMAMVNTSAAVAGKAAANSSGFAYLPVIPFSFGFKINVYKNIGLEAEYGFRKTFYDNFDGLKDLVAPSDIGLLHNNDWYTFTGIAVTWKIYNRLAGCPAYEDVGSKKKR
jgi:hypothetical protein